MSGDSLLNVGGLTPVLDGVTPVFVLLGADPTVAPGFQAPPGSIGNFNGTYYWKFGATATQWVVAPFGGAGGLSPLTTKGDLYGFSTLGARVPVGADGTFLLADSTAARGVSYSTAPARASWTAAFRYYFLDYDAGIDTNVGFIDGAAGATFTGGQTAAVAIKTIERLRQIVPTNGNGRGIIILQKLRAGGALYLKQDGVTTDFIDTSIWYGYSGGLLWRGSTDLTNNAADKVTCGFRIAVAGPGGSSEFTCAAGASTTVVPIAAGTIGAEAATQYRIRFLPTTTTVALRNICRVIVSGVVDTSVTLGNALPATPAVGDVFVIERPGVLVGTLNFDTTGLSATAGSLAFVGPQLVGIGFSTTASSGVFFGAGKTVALSGCEQIGSTTTGVVTALGAQTLTIRERYFDEAVGTQTLGMGFRCTCAATIGRNFAMDVQCWGSMNTAATLTLRPGPLGSFGALSYLGGNLNISGTMATGVNESTGTASVMFQIGDPTTSNAQPRVVGSGGATPFQIVDAPCNLWRLSFESGFASATHACIYLKHIVGGGINIDGCTGSGGNPKVGVEALQCAGLTLSMGVTIANTVTGTLGDLMGGNSGIIKHTDLTVGGFTDPQGNVWIGTAGKTSGQAVAVTNQGLSQIDVCSPLRIVATGNVLKSSASSPGTALVDGVALSTMAASSVGYMVSEGPCKAAMEIAVVGSDLLYLSATTPATFTKTPPALSGTNMLLRVGRALDSGGPGNVRMILRPELLAVTSDGVGP